MQRTQEVLQAKCPQQLGIIDWLVKENKVFLNKCEEFTKQLRMSDIKRNQNMHEDKTRFASEDKKLREHSAESENQRRGQFVESNTREIN